MQLISAESNKALGCKYRCVSVTFPFHYYIQIFEQKTEETGLDRKAWSSVCYIKPIFTITTLKQNRIYLSFRTIFCLQASRHADTELSAPPLLQGWLCVS